LLKFWYIYQHALALMKPKEKIHFPNLDALRCISALLIVIIHAEALKLNHGGEVISWLFYFESWGDIDVTLFFTLSGFLITFLLLREKRDTGSINLKDFYIRRVLKIWPLYYLIMIIGFFILPWLGHNYYGEYSRDMGHHFWKEWLGYMLFIPPLLMVGSGLPESMGPTWTIRVEELFYFFWPVIIRKSNNFLKTATIIIIAVVGIRELTVAAGYLFKDNPYYFIRITALAKLFLQYRISCMAIGGIAAYLVVYDYQKKLLFLYRKDVQIITYSILAILLFARIEIPFVKHEIYAALFAYLILNLGTNPKSIIYINYKVMSYLGTLAYGIYMYHPIMRILSMEMIKSWFGRAISGWQMEVIYYAMTIGSTILVSIVSYKLIEKPFLNLKKKFSFINSSVK